jgi:predicted DNA binding CopG/RHH family protein
MKKPLKLPKFKNEDQERDFWAKIDLADYYEPEDFVHVDFPKPTSRSISIRMPEYILARLKIKANELDIPYQTLMKQYIAKEVLRSSNNHIS